MIIYERVPPRYVIASFGLAAKTWGWGRIASELGGHRVHGAEDKKFSPCNTLKRI